MKKNHLFLILFCFAACRQKITKHPTVDLRDYQKAYAYYGHLNDSAFYYLNRIVTQHQDSLQTGTAYNYMATIQSDAGDYFGAQESLSLSLRYLDTSRLSHRACLTSDYNELGLTKLALKEPEAAIPFFDQAIRLTPDSSNRRTYCNNKALAYQEASHYREAITLYQQLLPGKNKPEAQARILSNLAMSRWLIHPQYPAAPDLLAAMSLRKRIHDDWGLSASYANLSHYFEKNQPDSALAYARRQYQLATLLRSPDDRLHALQRLTALSSGTATKRYFASYQSLTDSLQKARNAAKNQFALIRFNVQQKEADNVRLQQDNAAAHTRLVEQRLIIVMIVIAVLAGGLFGLAWYRRREQRILLESRKKELQLSQKVHDVVANGLYRVMSNIENDALADKEVLLDEIEQLYEQSRDISYEPVQRVQRTFALRLSELVNSFSNDLVRTATSGNEASVWEGLNDQSREQVFRVLHELLVNMAKHSRASLTVVNFQRQMDVINIEMFDDGVGMPSGVRYGNGLKSTVSRIRAIKGTITFEQNVPQGLLVKITLPVANEDTYV